jgi:hypothetical protein
MRIQHFLLIGIILACTPNLSSLANPPTDVEKMDKIVLTIQEAKDIAAIDVAYREYQAFAKAVSDKELKQTASKKVVDALTSKRDSFLSEYRTARRKRIETVIAGAENKEKLTKKRQEVFKMVTHPPERNQPLMEDLAKDIRSLYFGDVPAVNNDKQLAAIADKITKISRHIVDIGSETTDESDNNESVKMEVGDLIKKANADVEKTFWDEVLLGRDVKDILKFNEQLKDKVSPGEYEVVVLTNEYRIMMGRPPMKIDLKLVTAARKHSRNMKELNFFGHESPVKGSESFSQRAAAEGTSARSENITMAETAPNAFISWINSPPHHKNMLLVGQLFIGVGQFEGRWTEMLN